MEERFECLEKLYELNLEDAEKLIRIFEVSGDCDGLAKARRDKEKWEKKLKELQGLFN